MTVDHTYWADWASRYAINERTKGANAEQAKKTGGMLAALPSKEDATKLAVPGGEPVENLHVTLCYYGEDVTALPEYEQLLDWCGRLASGWEGPIEAEAWAWALFNPNHPEFDPCAVYLMGRTPAFGYLHGQAEEDGKHLWGTDFHEQHQPYVPHVTAGYGMDLSQLAYTGPITFDRLTLNWAGTESVFPL